MNKFILFIFLLMLCGCNEEKKYSASDCITRIEFLWQDESDREKTHIISEFMDSFIKEYIADNGTYFPPPSSAVQGIEQEFVFLQYTNKCSSKVDITKLITARILENSKSIPDVAFTNEYFKPSYKTILMTGPYWVPDK